VKYRNMAPSSVQLRTNSNRGSHILPRAVRRSRLPVQAPTLLVYQASVRSGSMSRSRLAYGRQHFQGDRQTRLTLSSLYRSSTLQRRSTKRSTLNSDDIT